MGVILKLLKINLPLWVFLSISVVVASYIVILKYNNYSLTSDIEGYKNEVKELNSKVIELTSVVENLDVKYKTKSDELELNGILLKSCYKRIDELSAGFNEINAIMNPSESCICDICLCEDTCENTCKTSDAQNSQVSQSHQNSSQKSKGITVETNRKGIQFMNRNFAEVVK